jgi:hypothetical protein
MKIFRIAILSAAVLHFASGTTPLWAHEGHKKMSAGASASSGTAAMGDMPGMDQSSGGGMNMAPSEHKSEIAMFLSHLKQPEYMHILINPIPIFGMGLGLLLLLVAWVRPAAGLSEAGLAIIIATGVITYPTIKLGQYAYDRVFETIPLDAQEWLDVHMARAERFQYLFYLAAILAGLTLYKQRRNPELARRLMLATMAVSGLCAALAGLIAHAGGQVRHTEFRTGPPTARALKHAAPAAAPERKETK